MPSARLNKSFLADKERAALAYIVQRLPHSVRPDHLTAVGLLGAGLAGACFLLCALSNWFLVGVGAGMFLNWFGDSLDGTLARYRKIERPHYGFLVDHSSDLIAQTMIVVGLGISPFFTLASSLFVLSLYMLISSYTYLRAAVEGVHRLSYGGLGATEFRLIVIGWPLLVASTGGVLVSGQIWGYRGLDVVIAALSVCAYLAFVYTVHKDLRRLDVDDPKRIFEAPVAEAARDEAAITDRPMENGDAAREAEDASPIGLAAHILAPYPKRLFN